MWLEKCRRTLKTLWLKPANHSMHSICLTWNNWVPLQFIQNASKIVTGGLKSSPGSINTFKDFRQNGINTPLFQPPVFSWSTILHQYLGSPRTLILTNIHPYVKKRGRGGGEGVQTMIYISNLGELLELVQRILKLLSWHDTWLRRYYTITLLHLCSTHRRHCPLGWAKHTFLIFHKFFYIIYKFSILVMLLSIS